MDWSRAKNIFILSFIVLNLFLAAQINNTIEEKSLFVQTGDITNQQIERFLKESQVKLAVKPTNVSEANPYSAQITKMPSDWSQEEKGHYTKTFPQPVLVKNESEFIQFINKQVPYFPSYRAMTSSSLKKTYLQVEHGMPIFDGQLIVSFTTDHRIRAIQILHYQTSRIKKVNLVSFNTALYNLLYSDELSRFTKPTITNAILGYNARSNPNQTDGYYLMPYWRFVVNGKHHVDVNALSGIIEQPEGYQQ